MRTSDVLPRMYEDLANHFARQGESRHRDECLVLAADAALNIGQPEDAERIRKRLLLTNPNHLLRPYTTMAEAMLSSDVRDYVADLRNQWPPETVAKLLNRPPAASTPDTIPLAPPIPLPTFKPAARAKPQAAPGMPVETVTATGYWLAVLMFVVGLIAAGGLLVVAIGGPFLY